MVAGICANASDKEGRPKINTNVVQIAQGWPGQTRDGVPPGSGLSIQILATKQSQGLRGRPSSLQHFAFFVRRKLAPALCHTK